MLPYYNIRRDNGNNYPNRHFVPNPSFNTTGYHPRPWQVPYQQTQGQGNRYTSTNEDDNKALRIDEFNQRPLQITAGDSRDAIALPHTSNQPPGNHRPLPYQQNRSWSSRPNGQLLVASTSTSTVSASHSEAADEMVAVQQYDNHQDYQAYEKQSYKGTYWTRPDEGRKQRSSDDSQQHTSTQETTSQNETVEAPFAIPRPIIKCRRCKQLFESKNKLHKHIRAGCKRTRSKITTSNTDEFVATTSNGSTNMNLTLTTETMTDTGITIGESTSAMTLTTLYNPTDQATLIKQTTRTTKRLYDLNEHEEKSVTTMAPSTTITTTPTTMALYTVPTTVRSDRVVTIDADTPLSSCTPATPLTNSFSTDAMVFSINTASTTITPHTINTTINASTTMDEMATTTEPERIVLEMHQQFAIVRSCKNRKARNGVTIPPYVHAIAPIQPRNLSDDRDLSFQLDEIVIYTLDVDWHMTAIQAPNDLGAPGTLRKDIILGTIGEIRTNGCCFAETNMALRAVTDTPRETTFIRVVLAAATDTSFEEGTQNPMDVSETCL